MSLSWSHLRVFTLAALAAMAVLLIGDAAFAQEAARNMAHNWQLGFQEPISPVKKRLDHVHDLLLVIITGITIFVLLLTVFICVRYSKKRNPVPADFTHNYKVEVAAVLSSVIILAIIAVPSLRLHYFMEEVPPADLTLKVTGHQWYWSYEYPDFGNFGFDSYMKEQKDLQPGEPRLLEVDNRVVVPVNANVRVQMTAADVIHSWAMPVLGIKRDAVPGRLNEAWFRAEKEGIFYGQCSEICGVKHGFMPIQVEVVSREKFNAWVAEKQAQAGITPKALDVAQQ